MSWLGKIMTFLVVVAALAWMYFTVTVFVTRTNWKARADASEKALAESEKNRVTEQRAWETQRAQLTALLETERARTKQQGDDYAALESLSKKGSDTNAQLMAINDQAAKTAALRDATEKATQAELKDTRDRNAKLEDAAVKLVLDKQTAQREQLKAENERNLQKAIADDYGRKIAELTALVTELRQTGGGGGTAQVLRTVQKEPTPLSDNTRGTVVRDVSAAGFVEISLGIDAGLEPGSKLDVYRESEGKYLGTLVVQGTSLRPKQAVATFRPARNVPLSQLRPDELPRKNDNVGIIR
ncbi:MAG: hypothetical protein ACKODX_14695 [Gemmata sp.]